MYFFQKQTDSDVEPIKKNRGRSTLKGTKSLFPSFTAGKHNNKIIFYIIFMNVFYLYYLLFIYYYYFYV